MMTTSQRRNIMTEETSCITNSGRYKLKNVKATVHFNLWPKSAGMSKIRCISSHFFDISFFTPNVSLPELDCDRFPMGRLRGSSGAKIRWVLVQEMGRERMCAGWLTRVRVMDVRVRWMTSRDNKERKMRHRQSWYRRATEQPPHYIPAFRLHCTITQESTLLVISMHARLGLNRYFACTLKASDHQRYNVQGYKELSK